MSETKNNSKSFSSFRSLKNINIKKNNNYSGISNGKNKSKFGLFNFGISGNNYLNKKNNEINNLNESSFIINNIPKLYKKNMNKQYLFKYYEPLIKYIINYIKSLLIDKYSIFYYKIKGNYIFDKNKKYLLYDYFQITNILDNKKSILACKLNEFNYIDNRKEILIRYYKKQEIYIIMKYLLNFIYKYDKLCFKKNKEITDIGKKEKIIQAFYYITSEQYIHKDPVEKDSSKEVKPILNNTSTKNKNISNNYLYSNVAKNSSDSKVNLVYEDNRSYFKRILINNYPIQRIPNAVPNYFRLGKEINECLYNYLIKRKFMKIEKHDETKELINKYKEKFFKQERHNNHQSKLRNKKLFNIQENIEENESDKSDLTSNVNKKKFRKVSTNKNILSKSNNDSNEINNKNEFSKELKNILKENNYKNKIALNEHPKFSHLDKRLYYEPEFKDIENLIKKFSKKIKSNPQINDVNKINIIKKLNKDKEKDKKAKFKISTLKIKKEQNNENQINNKKIGKITIKRKFIDKNKNNNIIVNPIKISNSSSILNYKETYSKLNKRNIDNSKNSYNSVSFLNETNYISSNLSSSFQITKKNIFLKKNNSINNPKNKLNYSNLYSNKKIKEKNNFDIVFKDTGSFIKYSKEHKHKLKPNIFFKNYFTMLSEINNSKDSLSELLRSKICASLLLQNSKGQKRQLYKKTDFEKIIFKIKKNFMIAKKRSSKSYTFKEVIKDCQIYNSSYIITNEML